MFNVIQCTIFELKVQVNIKKSINKLDFIKKKLL